MAFIDSTVVNVALPALQSSLGATVIDAQWVIESYGLLLGALILVGGSIGDLFGRRRTFLMGVTVFAIASVWCGLSPTIHQLIIARAIQGLGAAFLVPGSLALISASFDRAERGRAIGTWSGFTAITTALGPVLGGWLIQHASWRWAFFLNLPFAAAVIAISLKHVPESRSTAAKRVDWLGAAIVTVGLGGLVYGLIESARLGWGNPLVFGALTIGVLCLIAFFLVEARVAEPMVPLQLFQSRSFSGANLLTLFLYAATGIFFFLFPLNLIQVQGYTATATGAAALPFILLMSALSRWAGGLIARYGAQTATDRRPSHHSRRLLPFRHAIHRRQLLEHIFPSIHRARFRHDRQRRSSHHRGHGARSTRIARERPPGSTTPSHVSPDYSQSPCSGS